MLHRLSEHKQCLVSLCIRFLWRQLSECMLFYIHPLTCEITLRYSSITEKLSGDGPPSRIISVVVEIASLFCPSRERERERVHCQRINGVKRQGGLPLACSNSPQLPQSISLSGKIILEGTVNGREVDYTTLMFAVARR